MYIKWTSTFSQFHSTNSATCRDTYELPDFLSVKKGEDESRALCTSEYSDISPLRDGNVAFSSLEGRPSAINFEHSLELQVNRHWLFHPVRSPHISYAFIFLYRIGSQRLTSRSHWIAWIRSVTKCSATLKYWNHTFMPLLTLPLVHGVNVTGMPVNVWRAPVNIFFGWKMKLEAAVLTFQEKNMFFCSRFERRTDTGVWV